MPGAPYLAYPGSGSDHYTFMAYIGVPVIDLGRCSRHWSSLNDLFSVHVRPQLLRAVSQRIRSAVDSNGSHGQRVCPLEIAVLRILMQRTCKCRYGQNSIRHSCHVG